MGEQPGAVVDRLDDEAVRAFTVGFLDGLRSREATDRDNPNSSAVMGSADHG